MNGIVLSPSSGAQMGIYIFTLTASVVMGHVTD